MAEVFLVSVCACTYRRAHVVETVRSLMAQLLAPSQRFEIVVIDDDPDRSAEPMIAAIAADASVPIRYVVSGARNVSAARNAALDAATGEWIAFIDDDEIAMPDWLAHLVRVQRDSGADIVKGYVQGIYPPQTSDWVRDADPFTRDYGPDGATPSILASGNVLVRRAAIEAHKLRFDPQFGRSGGEDTDFFARLIGFGARAVASRSAVVHEIAPADRVTVAYLQARNRRAGQTDGRKARQAQRAARPGVIALAALCVTWTYPLLRSLLPRLSFRLFAKFWYSRGMIEGLRGRATEEM